VAGVIGAPRLITNAPSEPPAPAQQAAVPAAVKPLAYSKSPWEYAFKGYQVGKFTVNEPFTITPDFQQATVRFGDDVEKIYGGPPASPKPDAKGKNGVPDLEVVRTEPADTLLLTVYRPGRYDPKPFQGGEKVTVGGKPGLFKEGISVYGDAAMIPGHRGLAWQYADGGWAVLNTNMPDEAGQAGKQQLIDVAAGLGGTKAYPATAAMKLTAVPAGYKLYQGGRAPGYGYGGDSETYRSSLNLVKQDLPGKLTSPVEEDNARKNIRINLSTSAAKTDPPKGTDKNAPYCNSGNENLCYRVLPGDKYKIEIEGSGDVSSDELLQVLAGIQIADVDDPASWFRLATAVA
jgi:hypothetical protein